MKTVQSITMVLAGVVMTANLIAQAPPATDEHAAHAAHAKAAQNKPAAHKHGMMDDHKMMAACKMMMQSHEHDMGAMKMMDSKLEGLVAKMNAASGPDKSEAVAAVVNELVAQRSAMRDHMSSMQTGMMQHMMGHMQMGKQSTASAMKCPMMQAMHATLKGSKGVDDHAKHH